MKIPKIFKIEENGKIHNYKFIQRCNNNLFLYEEIKYKYKRCFTSWELGLVKEVIKPPKCYKNVEKVKL